MLAMLNDCPAGQLGGFTFVFCCTGPPPSQRKQRRLVLEHQVGCQHGTDISGPEQKHSQHYVYLKVKWNGKEGKRESLREKKLTIDWNPYYLKKQV